MTVKSRILNDKQKRVTIQNSEFAIILNLSLIYLFEYVTMCQVLVIK
jgi:hypothetical protein